MQAVKNLKKKAQAKKGHGHHKHKHNHKKQHGKREFLEATDPT